MFIVRGSELVVISEEEAEKLQAGDRVVVLAQQRHVPDRDAVPALRLKG